MTKKILFTILALVLLFAACKKPGDGIETPADPPAEPPVTDTVYTSEYSKNLTVVYFVPSDNDTVTGWHKRLSDIFIWGQDYFGKNMQRAGYGYKTFGIMKDAAKGLVKIVLIKGKLTKDKYPYSGGAAAASTEINEYKAAHPEEFTSDHVMVFLPAATYSASGKPGGVPFYGYGRWCFGIDYPYLNINYKGSTNAEEREGAGWVAATYHELAHGLNLPHDKEKISDKTTPGLGISLMADAAAGFQGIHNDGYFFTDAACSIFDVTQIFQKDGSSINYGSVTVSFSNESVSYDPVTASIRASGKFTSPVPVKSIAYYLDPEGGDDYDAVSWRGNVIGTDSFNISLPISELTKKGNMAYSLRLRLNHENGTGTLKRYGFTFQNNIPVISNKYNWKIIAQSSQTSGNPALNIIDGTPNTYWRSASSTLPHAFRGDFGSALTINKMAFNQRSDGEKPVKDFEIQFSDAPSTGFVSAGTFTATTTTGVQIFTLNAPVTKRYFRLVVTSNHDGTSEPAIGEIDFFNQ